MSNQLQGLRVAIVGLGLMGGSLALALRGKVAQLIGVDTNSNTLEQALRRRIVTQTTTNLLTGVAQADLVILATPVRIIVKQLETLAKHSPDHKVMLMDLGSTKQDIVRAMQELPENYHPIGGHPMCGKETPGLNSADAALFQQARFVLTQLERTPEAVTKIALELIETINAEPLFLEAARHDRLVATTSHLPFLMAASLIATGQQHAEEDELVWSLISSGFQDTTRLAATDTKMMQDILLTNRTFVRTAAECQRAALDALIQLLDGDEQILTNELSQLQSERLTRYPAAGFNS